MGVTSESYGSQSEEDEDECALLDTMFESSLVSVYEVCGPDEDACVEA